MPPAGPGRRPHRRSSLSAGLQWASAVTTIGLEMALPPLLGAWIDSVYKTSPWWTVAFAVVGFAAAMRHLWDLSKRLGGPRPAPAQPSPKNEPEAKPHSNGKGEGL